MSGVGAVVTAWRVLQSRHGPYALCMPTAESFDDAVARVRAMRLRPEMELAEAPPPRRMAPETHALTADVVVDDIEMGTGRLVVLHNPRGEDAWEGTTRLVLYLDAAVEPELAEDPLLPEVGWTWLEEALDHPSPRFQTGELKAGCRSARRGLQQIWRVYPTTFSRGRRCSRLPRDSNRYPMG